MPRAWTARNGWSSGEWTPYLLGRYDLAQYYRALQRAENFIVTLEGALVRRPPTRRLGLTKHQDQRVRLVAFVPTPDVSIVVEFGAGYARFWTQTGPIGGASPVEVVTPYTEADLPDLAWAQDADVLYVVHPRHPPQKLSRTGASTFTFGPAVWLNGRAPLAPLNLNADNAVTVGGTWPNITLTMAQPTFIAADVGRTFFVRDTGNKRAYYVTIDAVTTPTDATATGTFRIGTANPAASSEWAFGLFSATQGCRAIVFHESRLWYGGFTAATDVITGSVSNSFDNFETISPDTSLNESANADKGITRRVSGGSVDAVLWMLSGSDVLFVGTTSGEFAVRPGVTGFLTPTEAVVRRATQRGSASVLPVRVDSTAFFVQRGATRLRQVKYDIENDGFVTVDATLLSSHLVEGGIRRVVYQQSPHSILWMVDRNDNLSGLTIESDQEVLGAHRHRLGGGFCARAPRVIDLEAVPGVATGRIGEPLTAAAQDVVFMAVRRTQGGALQQTIEVMEPLPPALAVDQPAERQAYYAEQAVHMDCQTQINTQWQIEGGAEIGGELRFTYTATSPTPLAGTGIVFRGIAWRLGQTIVSLTAGNRRPFDVLSVDAAARTFSIALPGSAVALTLADLGLPAGTVLTLCLDELPPVAGEITSAVTHPPSELGDTYAFAADGRLLNGTGLAGRPASLVIGGYAYRSEFQTMPLQLLPQQQPADMGEPGVVKRVTLRLWASIGGFIEADGATTGDRIVTATTADIMDAPPAPRYKDYSVPVAGSHEGDRSLRVYTEEVYPLTVLALSAQLETQPR